MGSDRTFFDTLSRDEVTVLVRHLSEKPRFSEWASWVSNEQLRLLFDEHSAFLSVALKMFQRLVLNGPRGGEARRELPRAICFDGLDVPVYARRLVTGRLEHVAISGFYAGGILEELARTCRGLRSLKLGVWESMAPTKSVIDVVRTQARSLEELRILRHSPGNILGGLSLPRLKVLYLKTCYLENVTLAFEACTDALLELYIDGMRGATKEKWLALINILHIQRRKFCNLNTVVLKRKTVPIPDYEHTALLGQFGTRLRRAELDDLSVSACKKILTLCPNVECELSVTNALALSRLVVVAPHVTELFMGDVRHCDELVTASSICKKVTSLTCRVPGIDASGLEALFSDANFTLDNLSIHGPFITMTPQLNERIALCCRALRSLDLTLHSVEQVNSLCDVIQAAQQLEKIRCKLVRLFDDDREAVQFCTSVLTACRHLLRLDSVSVRISPRSKIPDWNQFHHAVASSVGFLRLRRLQVCVCNVEYFL